MKYILILLLLLSYNSNVVEPDKMKHFAVSSAISSAGYVIFRIGGMSVYGALASSIVTTMAIGALKEASDDHWDNGDMGANLIGAVLVPIIFVLL